MKKKTLLVTILLSTAFSACNDSFLEKYPGDKMTEQTLWQSEADFRGYALNLYDFHGFGVGNDQNVIQNNSDEICRGAMNQNSRIFDRRVIPETGGSWSWTKLRDINIMVTAARNCNLDEDVKLHWEGVARFFRAKEYFSKVKAFNDVPWIGKELTTSSEELFNPKDPRALVMDSVLADINFAVEHIRIEDEENQVNRDVALALKSEICLFEGTYRKYHKELNLQDWEKWLKECIKASETLMERGYTLCEDYRSLYSSLDLAGNPEIILYKQYEAGVISNQMTTAISSGESSTGTFGGTKDAVEAYLCKDGLPYGVSPLHPKAIAGEPEFLEEEFKDRDPRLLMSFVLPYNDSNPTQLPAMDHNYSGDLPPFMSAFTGEGYIHSPSGYHIYKYWNPDSPNTDATTGITDAPIYTLSIILLNYAEAMEELGLCTNDVLDKSINLLRRRVGMPDLTVEFANKINDPKKGKFAPEISPLLWEIRRERQVELIFDGSRFSDILRWKKASYFSKPFVGCYVDLEKRPQAAYNEDGTPKFKAILGDREGNVIPGATKGYVLPYNGELQPVYSDNDLKLYYEPINKQELTLNPNLTQSPGWENE